MIPLQRVRFTALPGKHPDSSLNISVKPGVGSPNAAQWNHDLIYPA